MLLGACNRSGEGCLFFQEILQPTPTATSLTTLFINFELFDTLSPLLLSPPPTFIAY